MESVEQRAQGLRSPCRFHYMTPVPFGVRLVHTPGNAFLIQPGVSGFQISEKFGSLGFGASTVPPGIICEARGSVHVDVFLRWLIPSDSRSHLWSLNNRSTPHPKYLCGVELICSHLRLLPVTAFSAPLVCLWHLVVISVTTHQAISRDINGEPCVPDLRLVLGWGGLVRTGDAQPVKEFIARTIVNLGRGGG